MNEILAANIAAFLWGLVWFSVLEVTGIYIWFYSKKAELHSKWYLYGLITVLTLASFFIFIPLMLISGTINWIDLKQIFVSGSSVLRWDVIPGFFIGSFVGIFVSLTLFLIGYRKGRQKREGADSVSS
jgi:hypothetical protein